MSVNNLSKKNRQLIIDQYASSKSRKVVQNELSEAIGVTPRCIRKYAKELSISVKASNIVNDKIMVYDIETSRAEFKLFWTGKQYVPHTAMKKEPKIISVAWKWIGQDKVHSLNWDKNHCDKKLMIDFLKQYNKASMVIGQNNNSFDNKWINTRAAKHKLRVDRYVKSFDIYRMAKRYFRLPSYSMAFMAKYFGLTLKQSHEGMYMWDMIEGGTAPQQTEYLGKMDNYNRGDIVTTEE